MLRPCARLSAEQIVPKPSSIAPSIPILHLLRLSVLFLLLNRSRSRSASGWQGPRFLHIYIIRGNGSREPLQLACGSQTFLQSCGVPSTLPTSTRNICEQQIRGQSLLYGRATDGAFTETNQYQEAIHATACCAASFAGDKQQVSPHVNLAAAIPLDCCQKQPARPNGRSGHWLDVQDVACRMLWPAEAQATLVQFPVTQLRNKYFLVRACVSLTSTQPLCLNNSCNRLWLYQSMCIRSADASHPTHRLWLANKHFYSLVEI